MHRNSITFRVPFPASRGIRSVYGVYAATSPPGGGSAFTNSDAASRTYTSRAAGYAPRIFQPGFWRPFAGLRPTRRIKSSGEWNPATFFILIFLCIGSTSIHQLRSKQDFDTFIRLSNQRIATLREVLERVQRGEDVDVEKLLGTGDEKQEMEWEEVLEEIQRIGTGQNDRSKDDNDNDGKAAANSQPSSLSPSLPPARDVSATNKGGQAPIEEKKKPGLVDSSFY